MLRLLKLKSRVNKKRINQYFILDTLMSTSLCREYFLCDTLDLHVPLQGILSMWYTWCPHTAHTWELTARKWVTMMWSCDRLLLTSTNDYQLLLVLFITFHISEMQCWKWMPMTWLCARLVRSSCPNPGRHFLCCSEGMVGVCREGVVLFVERIGFIYTEGMVSFDKGGGGAA